MYIYIYTGTINVKTLKASFVSKEQEHFMAFFPKHHNNFYPFVPIRH